MSSLPLQAHELRLCYEDVPQSPWTMPNGTGQDIELIQHAGRLTGERFVFLARPWRRCVEELRQGLVDGVVGMAYSPERAQFAYYPIDANGKADPAQALHVESSHVYLRRKSQADWDGKTLHNPRRAVVAQAGYISADVLRENGFEVIDSIKSIEEGLRMLSIGLADAAVLHGDEGIEILKRNDKLASVIRVAPQPFSHFPLFLTFSKKSLGKDTHQINAVWKAIATLRQPK